MLLKTVKICHAGFWNKTFFFDADYKTAVFKLMTL